MLHAYCFGLHGANINIWELLRSGKIDCQPIWHFTKSNYLKCILFRHTMMFNFLHSLLGFLPALHVASVVPCVWQYITVSRVPYSLSLCTESNKIYRHRKQLQHSSLYNYTYNINKKCAAKMQEDTSALTRSHISFACFIFHTLEMCFVDHYASNYMLVHTKCQN